MTRPSITWCYCCLTQGNSTPVECVFPDCVSIAINGSAFAAANSSGIYSWSSQLTVSCNQANGGWFLQFTNLDSSSPYYLQTAIASSNSLSLPASGSFDFTSVGGDTGTWSVANGDCPTTPPGDVPPPEHTGPAGACGACSTNSLPWVWQVTAAGFLDSPAFGPCSFGVEGFNGVHYLVYQPGSDEDDPPNCIWLSGQTKQTFSGLAGDGTTPNGTVWSLQHGTVPTEDGSSTCPGWQLLPGVTNVDSSGPQYSLCDTDFDCCGTNTFYQQPLGGWFDFCAAAWPSTVTVAPWTSCGEGMGRIRPPSLQIATPAARPARPVQSAPQPRTKPCVHLGATTGYTILCPTCTGKVSLKLFQCSLHNVCTLTKTAAGIACCKTCPDYLPKPQ